MSQYRPLLFTLVTLMVTPVVAEESHSSGMSHKQKQHEQQQHKQSQHKVMEHQGKHQGMQHGGHGAIAKGIEKFPTSSYTKSKPVRAIQKPDMPKMQGNPVKGKHLVASSKGRCLACHIVSADKEQAGDVGSNLSTYSGYGRSTHYTFQQIWDARAHNAKTLMPPLGTNGVLNKHEVMHIIAYLETLNEKVAAPLRPKLESKNYYVAGEDLTLADDYIDEGEALFKKQGKNGMSCASCHTSGNSSGKAPSLKGVAASYPKYDKQLNKVALIETRNNYCRKNYMHSDSYKLGSRDSNTLSSYIKYLARNETVSISTSLKTQKAMQKGKQSFYKKTGQLNFSCADCHDSASGKWLRGQSLSSIKLGGEHSYTAATWPKHFIALHDLGLISMQQRIRHCQIVTRTYPLKLGAPEYVNMELFITNLATGKPMQAPTKSKLRGAD